MNIDENEYSGQGEQWRPPQRISHKVAAFASMPVRCRGRRFTGCSVPWSQSASIFMSHDLVAIDSVALCWIGVRLDKHGGGLQRATIVRRVSPG
jgi:hypothetical protein